jgi:hypothetical protein
MTAFLGTECSPVASQESRFDSHGEPDLGTHLFQIGLATDGFHQPPDPRPCDATIPNPAKPEATDESIPRLESDEAVINHRWTRMITDSKSGIGSAPRVELFGNRGQPKGIQV